MIAPMLHPPQQIPLLISCQFLQPSLWALKCRIPFGMGPPGPHPYTVSGCYCHYRELLLVTQHATQLWCLTHDGKHSYQRNLGQSPQIRSCCPPNILLFATFSQRMSQKKVLIRVSKWHKSPEGDTPDKSYVAAAWKAAGIADEMSRRSGIRVEGRKGLSFILNVTFSMW